MDYIHSFIPESFYIFSNLYQGQKSPHLYAIQLEQELGKKTRVEFISSGNELDCKVIQYKNYILGSDEYYADYSNFNINKTTSMGKNYIDITQADKEEDKIDYAIISIFSKNGGHIAGTEQTKLSYEIRYTTYSDYGIFTFNDADETGGEVDISRIEDGDLSNITTTMKKLKYKKNDGEWTEIVSTTAGTPISVVSGDTIQFRGDNLTYATSTSKYNSFSGTTAGFNVSGNIMSLISSSDFATLNVLTSSYTLVYFMRNCTGLTDASKLVLPATKVRGNCYYYMFDGCTSLATAPELPATSLSLYCYNGMFHDCTSLTKAPSILPATTLDSHCYAGMFHNCTSLTTAPELPATTLADSCYYAMFANCTSLATAPELPATALANNCYRNMFYGCTSLISAPQLPATTLADYCYDGMFYNCTNLTTTQALLPATTLAIYCYWDMFNGCTSLTTAPELPATTLASNCYRQMFNGCWSLNYIKAMFTTEPKELYTYKWVYGVAKNGTFVKNSAATWDVTGENGVPTNWTVETASA
jgi:hypothetical protein